MPSITKLKALLVGVNEHDKRSHQNGVTDLRGCVNDVEAMKALLERKFGHLNPDIKTLVNEQATRQNIIDTFRSHLRDQADAHTTTLFYFSGHGSRQNTPEPFHRYIADKFYKLEETLICHDSRVSELGEPDLADKEQAILIEEVAKKQAHVVVILDCCHSGSGTRAVPDGTDPELVTITKEVKASEADYTFNRTYLDNYYEKLVQAGQVPQIPDEKHVLLAGCKRDQYSKEIYVKELQQRRGAFTYYLEKAIEQYGIQLSYANLYSHVNINLTQAEFQKPESRQTPQIDPRGGFQVDDHFLQGNAPSHQAKLYPTRQQGKTWIADFGFAARLTAKFKQDVQFALYDSPHQNTLLTHAKASHIGLNQSRLEPTHPERLAKVIQCWAKPTNLFTEKYGVQIIGSDYHVNQLKYALASSMSPYVQFSDSPNAPLKVVFKANRYEIFHHNQYQSKQEIANDADYKEAVHKLEKIIKWETLLYTANPKSIIEPEDFDLYLVEGKYRGQANPDGQTQDFHSYRIQAKAGKHYQDEEKLWKVRYNLVLHHTSPYTLYYTIFGFSADYEIRFVTQEPAPKTSDPMIYTDTLTPLPNGEEVFYFKLIVSTKEIMPHLLTQKGIDNNDKRPADYNPEAFVPEDWNSKTIRVRLSRGE